MLSLDKVFDAQMVLKNIIRETNVVRAYGIANDCELYLKPENLQITGHHIHRCVSGCFDKVYS